MHVSEEVYLLVTTSTMSKTVDLRVWLSAFSSFSRHHMRHEQKKTRKAASEACNLHIPFCPNFTNDSSRNIGRTIMMAPNPRKEINELKIGRMVGRTNCRRPTRSLQPTQFTNGGANVEGREVRESCQNVE